MPDRLTDADLINRLQEVARKGTLAAAASALGISKRGLQTSLEEARAKGLTATSQPKDEMEKLRLRLHLAERDLKAIERANDTAASIRQTIYNLAAVSPSPPAWLDAPAKTKHGFTGVPMTMWSDFHWGEVVRSAEVGGVNSFNRAIAKERLRRLTDTVIDLAINHMTNPKYPGIVVALGGDIIGGNIHEELRDTNEGYVQQSLLEVQEHLEAALTRIADKFGKVFVPCVVGNHGRNTLKPRMKGRVFENYEWNLYCQLEKYFRNDPRIQFLIPGETDAYFSVLGHRFLLTHGDTLGVKGGDGIIGALGPIARGTFKVGRSEAQIGRDFDTLLMGHYHTYIPRGEAVPVIVNGCLKGYDEYARLGLRVPYSRPSQALWFVHPARGITAQWRMDLDTKRKSSDTADWVSFSKRRNETF